MREEEERRKEVSNKFNNTLSEISNLMQENTDKNTKLRDENQEMAAWLKDLVKQYESREEVNRPPIQNLCRVLKKGGYITISKYVQIFLLCF